MNSENVSVRNIRCTSCDKEAERAPEGWTCDEDDCGAVRNLCAVCAHGELSRERDEARAELEHAYREGGALYEAKIAQREAEAERDEARAEVERLRDSKRSALPPVNPEHEAIVDGMLAQTRAQATKRPICSDAYRRGAEAMREACAQRVTCLADACPCQGKKHAENIRALPIPEDTP